METIHIFYIASNFHFSISLEIISLRKIDKKNIIFIKTRGVDIPEKWSDNILKIDNKEIFKFREKFLAAYRHDPILNIFDKKNNIIAYIPFFHQIPIFYKNVVFFEEGFASHCPYVKPNLKYRIIQFSKSILKVLLVYTLFIKYSRSIKIFILGPIYLSIRFNSLKEYNYYTLSLKNNMTSYKNFIIHKITLPRETNHMGIYSGSTIIVLDRFTYPIPYTIANYICYLNILFKKLDINFAYLKIHPADYKNSEIKKLVIKLLNSLKIEYQFIETSLEKIASANMNLTFIGTSSTILYYAPLLGNNISISYLKYLADIDNGYKKSFDKWGGVGGFINIFSENVIIKDVGYPLDSGRYKM